MSRKYIEEKLKLRGNSTLWTREEDYELIYAYMNYNGPARSNYLKNKIANKKKLQCQNRYRYCFDIYIRKKSLSAKDKEYILNAIRLNKFNLQKISEKIGVSLYIIRNFVRNSNIFPSEKSEQDVNEPTKKRKNFSLNIKTRKHLSKRRKTTSESESDLNHNSKDIIEAEVCIDLNLPYVGSYIDNEIIEAEICIDLNVPL